MRDGAMQDDMMRDGAMQDDMMQDDATPDGVMPDGAVRDDTMRDGAVQDGTMRNGWDAGTRERLCGRRILVLGPESGAKQGFLRIFEKAAGGRFEILAGADKAGGSFTILTDAGKMCQDDYVILFGFQDPVAASQRGGVWDGFSAMAGVMQKIRAVKPEAALLVSRADVYGKLFGEFHPVKEDELGYVCHTDARDQDAEMLRVLEHLCGRMAREDGIRVKIARLPGAGGGMLPDWGRTVEACIHVLLDGNAGEAYNVPGPARQGTAGGPELLRQGAAGGPELLRQGTADGPGLLRQGAAGALDPARRETGDAAGASSPLAPFVIVTDTGKAEKLG